MKQKSPAGTRQTEGKLGLVCINIKKISQIINDYLFLPFFGPSIADWLEHRPLFCFLNFKGTSYGYTLDMRRNSYRNLWGCSGSYSYSVPSPQRLFKNSSSELSDRVKWQQQSYGRTNQCCGSASHCCGSGFDLSPWCGSEFWFLFDVDPDADPYPDFYLMRMRIRTRLFTLTRIWIRIQIITSK